jgi:integrase/recombinase XerD
VVSYSQENYCVKEDVPQIPQGASFSISILDSSSAFSRFHKAGIKSSTVNLDYLPHFIKERKANGNSSETILRMEKALKSIARQCDLNNPYEVKDLIANKKWKNSTKTSFTYFYSAYLKFLGKSWNPPKYRTEKRYPFIPTEEEIDNIISSARRKYATLLTLLKETGMRTSELMMLQWIDIDTERKTISVTPAKGSNPRTLPLSNKLLGMLSNLPKRNKTICDMSKHTFRTVYEHLRNSQAKKLNNPRIRQITLHTLRHWKGTMEYHKTKDIVHVKYILGHKDINSTMIYINIEQATFLSNTDEWTCKAATTPKEAIELIESGFEYVTEIDRMKLFRKRK